MFDIDSGKLLIVAVLALVVIGPKELPRVLRQIGQAVGKMRRMAGEFQGQFMDAMKEADIADIRKELDELKAHSALDVRFDPVNDIKTEMSAAMAPVAVTSNDTGLSSPAEGFVLPTIDLITSEGPQPDKLGDAAGPNLPGTSVPLVQASDQPDAVAATSGLRRKVFIKRRASRFHIVQAEGKAALTGQPLATRHLAVRAKAIEGHRLSEA